MTITALNTHRRCISTDLAKMEREYDKSQTGHILHLLLTVLTSGIWIIVWAIIASQNKDRRKWLEELIDDSKLALIEIDEKLETETSR